MAAGEANFSRNDFTNKNDHLRRVREAAEALFKPKAFQPALAGATAQPAAALSKPVTLDETAQPTVMMSELNARPARQLPEQKPHAVVAATTSAAERKIVRHNIPKSEHGRIRILATYGMTMEQVAAVYDVTIDTIEKIIL